MTRICTTLLILIFSVNLIPPLLAGKKLNKQAKESKEISRQLRKQIEGIGGMSRGEGYAQRYYPKKFFPPPGFPKGMFFSVSRPSFDKLTKLKIDRPFGLFLRGYGGPTEIVDPRIPNLPKFENLEALSLYGDIASEKALAHVGRISKLRVLQLCCSSRVGNGFKHLTGLKNLQTICLHVCNKVDYGFLPTLKKLELLVLKGGSLPPKKYLKGFTLIAADNNHYAWKKTTKTPSR